MSHYLKKGYNSLKCNHKLQSFISSAILRIVLKAIPRKHIFFPQMWIVLHKPPYVHPIIFHGFATLRENLLSQSARVTAFCSSYHCSHVCTRTLAHSRRSESTTSFLRVTDGDVQCFDSEGVDR